MRPSIPTTLPFFRLPLGHWSSTMFRRPDDPSFNLYNKNWMHSKSAPFNDEISATDCEHAVDVIFRYIFRNSNFHFSWNSTVNFEYRFSVLGSKVTFCFLKNSHHCHLNSGHLYSTLVDLIESDFHFKIRQQ